MDACMRQDKIYTYTYWSKSNTPVKAILLTHLFIRYTYKRYLW